MTQTVLIIMAHGSRNPAANSEFGQLVSSIAKQTSDYAIVTPCFLELAQPSLQDAISEYLKLGYHQFDLYPLFFNQGNHVTRDIPAQINQAQEQHQECVIRQLDYFGKFNQLGNSVIAHIQQQNYR